MESSPNRPPTEPRHLGSSNQVASPQRSSTRAKDHKERLNIPHKHATLVVYRSNQSVSMALFPIYPKPHFSFFFFLVPLSSLPTFSLSPLTSNPTKPRAATPSIYSRIKARNPPSETHLAVGTGAHGNTRSARGPRSTRGWAGSGSRIRMGFCSGVHGRASIEKKPTEITGKSGEGIETRKPTVGFVKKKKPDESGNGGIRGGVGFSGSRVEVAAGSLEDDMVTKRGCVRHKQWNRIGGILGECDEDSRRMEEGWKKDRKEKECVLEIRAKGRKSGTFQERRVCVAIGLLE